MAPVLSLYTEMPPDPMEGRGPCFWAPQMVAPLYLTDTGQPIAGAFKATVVDSAEARSRGKL